jgi:hypothetical protein
MSTSCAIVAQGAYQHHRMWQMSNSLRVSLIWTVVSSFSEHVSSHSNAVTSSINSTGATLMAWRGPGRSARRGR